MSVGPTAGIAASAAGAPLAQTKGSETERVQQDAKTQQRQVQSAEAAEKASGIGQTEHDEGVSDRDADGRRIWEVGPDAQNEEEEKEQDAAARLSRDATGQSGNELDLTG